MLKRIGRSDGVRRLIGETLAAYLLFVRRTNPLALEPADMYERVKAELPVIVAMWHGQHFMMPFARPDGWDVRVMISRSGDGEINAIAASRLGMGLIRASGSQQAKQILKRGGVRGFLEVLKALKEGASVAITADVPKGPARVAGEGIVALAERSGRPIVPMAIATSRRIDLDTWDKATVNLPFGRAALVMGAPIAPPAGEAEREAVRRAVEAGLNDATARAYAIADRCI
jgi:lysophospholipid acyltransferase (LPLAT)-like uncharacterized protein